MRSSGLPLGFSFAAKELQKRIPHNRVDPYHGFNFAIEIEGLLIGGFTDVTGLESHVTTKTYREGGVNNYVHHLPEQVEQTNITLKRGLTNISTLWNWYYSVTQGIVQRRNGTIILLDAQKTPVMWWNFRNAYPVKWTGPQFQAKDDAIAFESIELVHEGFAKPILSEALALGRAIF